MQKFRKYLKFALCLQLLILTLPVRAELNPTTKDQTFPKEIHFTPPEDGETPDTVGAGTRNPNEFRCSPEEEQIQSLMPKGNYGLTLQEIPAIYVYLPQTSAKQVVLAIQDETEAYHEIAFIPITKNSQIVSFTLPENKPALTPGKHYKWKLTLVCGDIPDVEDPKLEGWVKRVDRNNLPTEFSQTNEIAQLDWYGKNGYWYDLLLQLEKAKQANPEDPDLTSLWQNLLQRVQAGEL